MPKKYLTKQNYNVYLICVFLKEKVASGSRFRAYKTLVAKLNSRS